MLNNCKEKGRSYNLPFEFILQPALVLYKMKM